VQFSPGNSNSHKKVISRIVSAEVRQILTKLHTLPVLHRCTCFYTIILIYRRNFSAYFYEQNPCIKVKIKKNYSCRWMLIMPTVDRLIIKHKNTLANVASRLVYCTITSHFPLRRLDSRLCWPGLCHSHYTPIFGSTAASAGPAQAIVTILLNLAQPPPLLTRPVPQSLYFYIWLTTAQPEPTAVSDHPHQRQRRGFVVVVAPLWFSRFSRMTTQLVQFLIIGSVEDTSVVAN
jgi:hypothetical protein